MDRIQGAQDLTQMRVLVNRIMNMRVREHFLHQLSVSKELVRLKILINFMMQGLRSGADRYSDCEKIRHLYVIRRFNTVFTKFHH